MTDYLKLTAYFDERLRHGEKVFGSPRVRAGPVGISAPKGRSLAELMQEPCDFGCVERGHSVS